MNATGPPARLKNRYRLAEWIGESETGIVYRAHDDVHDRDVAIKFLPPVYFTNAEATANFLNEAQALDSLSHPCIESVYDAGAQHGWHYLVRELVSGQTLHEIVVNAVNTLKGLQFILNVHWISAFHILT